MCTYKTTLFSEFFNMSISGSSMRDKETIGTLECFSSPHSTLDFNDGVTVYRPDPNQHYFILETHGPRLEEIT